MNIAEYFWELGNVIGEVDPVEIEATTRLLVETYRRDGTIFVIGNGQSAATASAFALDLSKAPAASPGKPRARVISLCDNTAALTAWANDISYEKVFTEQLVSLFRPGDALLAISASGNSPNIVDACRWMRAQGGVVIGLAGFGGGRLKELAQACVVVKSRDYGHVETVHVAINHFWVDTFKELIAE